MRNWKTIGNSGSNGNWKCQKSSRRHGNSETNNLVGDLCYMELGHQWETGKAKETGKPKVLSDTCVSWNSASHGKWGKQPFSWSVPWNSGSHGKLGNQRKQRNWKISRRPLLHWKSDSNGKLRNWDTQGNRKFSRRPILHGTRAAMGNWQTKGNWATGNFGGDVCYMELGQPWETG